MFALIAVRSVSDTLFGSSSTFRKHENAGYKQCKEQYKSLLFHQYPLSVSTDFVVLLLHLLHGETHNSPVSFDVILECDSSADANHVVLGLLQQREE